jgi:hypothetical protein
LAGVPVARHTSEGGGGDRVGWRGGEEHDGGEVGGCGDPPSWSAELDQERAITGRSRRRRRRAPSSIADAVVGERPGIEQV